MTTKRRLILLGASGHGRVCADIAEAMGYQDICFLDNNLNQRTLLKYPIIGKISEIDQFFDEDADFFVAIGNNYIRKDLFELLNDNRCRPINLIHPTAIISSHCEIEVGGVLVCEGTIIKTSAKIEKGCIINTAAIIEHDCIIHEFSHISPGSTLGGTVIIGANSWVGIGATIINNISIGDNCIIGAGSVVIKDVPDNRKIVGVPHRDITER